MRNNRHGADLTWSSWLTASFDPFLPANHLSPAVEGLVPARGSGSDRGFDRSAEPGWLVSISVKRRRAKRSAHDAVEPDAAAGRARVGEGGFRAGGSHLAYEAPVGEG